MKLQPGFSLLSWESDKIIVGPLAEGMSPQAAARIISGNSKGWADFISQGLSGLPEQQSIVDRICCSAEGCMCVGLA